MCAGRPRERTIAPRRPRPARVPRRPRRLPGSGPSVQGSHGEPRASIRFSVRGCSVRFGRSGASDGWWGANNSTTSPAWVESFRSLGFRFVLEAI